jgi:integrase
MIGHRRSDVARVRWDDLQNVVQAKTGKALWLPMHPALQTALEATERRGEYVLMTSRGKPFTVGGLGSQFTTWSRSAGLGKGNSLHGLRKRLGKDWAESGATAKEIMAMLGHETMQQASLYTKDAEQRRLASEGMKKLLANRNG